MKPIRLAILWHQHQPYYRVGDRFVMPWAWLHAAKDYLEMAQHFERHSGVKGTINLVPSLIKQLKEYLSGEAKDQTVELMSKDSASLSVVEKKLMLAKFFMANREHTIRKSPRYLELLDRAEANLASENRHDLFSEQDYRDLAVHFSLAWTGEIAKREEPLKSFVAKDRDYLEEDKRLLAEIQRKNVEHVLTLHSKLAKSGQLELTTTPFYHPILPLVIDTDSAKESMPGVTLPPTRFRRPADANEQLRRGREYFEQELGVKPVGLWPSEGSLSEAALELIHKHGYHWTATDEQVLSNSLGDRKIEIDGKEIASEHAKYFPWKYDTESGSIAVFFRDHHLSDNIGFTYQSWKGEDAAGDLVNQIRHIRTELIDKYGESILDTACVSIVLDGENCWEYYSNNGFDFLDALYTTLESEPLIETIRFSDARSGKKMPKLESLKAGSWINGNFRIWIGHAEDNAAWDALSKAREVYDAFADRSKLLEATAKEKAERCLHAAYEVILIAEGSDWCWWYGDDHYSNDEDTFDELFRTHIRAVYSILDLRVPEELLIPIPKRPDLHEKYGGTRPVQQSEEPPTIAGKLLNESWSGITNILPAKQYGAMHKASDVELEEVKIAEHDGKILFRGILSIPFIRGGSLQITFSQPKGVIVSLSRKTAKVLTPFVDITTFEWMVDETIEWSLPVGVFGEGTKHLSFGIELVKSNKTLARFPDSGSYECDIPSV